MCQKPSRVYRHPLGFEHFVAPSFWGLPTTRYLGMPGSLRGGVLRGRGGCTRGSPHLRSWMNRRPGWRALGSGFRDTRASTGQHPPSQGAKAPGPTTKHPAPCFRAEPGGRGDAAPVPAGPTPRPSPPRPRPSPPRPRPSPPRPRPPESQASATAGRGKAASWPPLGFCRAGAQPLRVPHPPSTREATPQTRLPQGILEAGVAPQAPRPVRGPAARGRGQGTVVLGAEASALFSSVFLAASSSSCGAQKDGGRASSGGPCVCVLGSAGGWGAAGQPWRGGTFFLQSVFLLGKV